MRKLTNPHRLGLAIGGFLGLFHFFWSLLIAGGLAQPLLDFVFELHRIDPPYTVMPFSFSMMIGLVVVTFVFGYIAGVIMGWLWEMARK